MHTWDTSKQRNRAAEIKNELVDLYNQQANFYRKGGPSNHTKSEIEEFEKRRTRVRDLFAELERAKSGLSDP